MDYEQCGYYCCWSIIAWRGSCSDAQCKARFRKRWLCRLWRLQWKMQRKLQLQPQHRIPASRVQYKQIGSVSDRAAIARSIFSIGLSQLSAEGAKQRTTRYAGARRKLYKKHLSGIMELFRLPQYNKGKVFLIWLINIIVYHIQNGCVNII